jgi:hypothetical protein
MQEQAGAGTRRPVPKRDLMGGAVLILLGLGVIAEGWRHSVGTLAQVGPGFLPVILGCAIVFVGILIALSAFAGDHQHEESSPLPDVRGALAILVGVAVFLIAGEYLGFAVAAFGCVFISALGDRSSTLLSSFVLALAMTGAGIFVFWYLLEIPFPLFQW